MPPLLFDKLKLFLTEDQLAVDTKEQDYYQNRQNTSHDTKLLPLLVFSRSTFCSLTPRIMSDQFHINSKFLHFIAKNNVDTFQFATSICVAVKDHAQLRSIREKLFPDDDGGNCNDRFLIRYLQHVSLAIKAEPVSGDVQQENERWANLLVTNPYYHSTLISFSLPGRIFLSKIAQEILKNHPSDEVRVSCVKTILAHRIEYLKDGQWTERANTFSILVSDILMSKNVTSFEHASWYASLLATCMAGYFTADDYDNQYSSQPPDSEASRSLIRRTLEGFESILVRRETKKRGNEKGDESAEIRFYDALGKEFLWNGVLGAFGSQAIRSEVVSALMTMLSEVDDGENETRLFLLGEIFNYMKQETKDFFDRVADASKNGTELGYSAGSHYGREEAYCNFIASFLDASPKMMSRVFLFDFDLVEFLSDMLSFAKAQATNAKSRVFDNYSFKAPGALDFVGMVALKFVAGVMENFYNNNKNGEEDGKRIVKNLLKRFVTETEILEILSFKFIRLGLPKPGRSQDWTPSLCSLAQHHLKFICGLVDVLTNPEIMEEGDEIWLETKLLKCYIEEANNKDNNNGASTSLLLPFTVEGSIFDLFFQCFPRSAFSISADCKNRAVRSMGSLLRFYQQQNKVKDFDSLRAFVKKKYWEGSLPSGFVVADDMNFYSFVS